MDSNQRRLSQRIYSPSPLATRALLHSVEPLSEAVRMASQTAPPQVRGVLWRVLCRCSPALSTPICRVRSQNALAPAFSCFQSPPQRQRALAESMLFVVSTGLFPRPRRSLEALDVGSNPQDPATLAPLLGESRLSRHPLCCRFYRLSPPSPALISLLTTSSLRVRLFGAGGRARFDSCTCNTRAFRLLYMQ